jgi:phosphomannomutase
MSDSYQFDPTILREYDIRGVVGKTLGEADARAIGQAYGNMLRRAGGRSIAVGRDGRLSSPGLEAALVEGLVSTGLLVYRIGLGPTPMLYFAVYDLDADGGIAITGSHNPPDYNGFKMVFLKRPFYGEQIQELGRIAAAGDFETGEGSTTDKPVFDAYVNRLLKDYDGAALNVAWDPGNGSAGEVTKAMTARLKGRHIVINGEIDGSFPNHHPDPTEPKNLVQLQELVAKEKLDLGIAFDGDGDRIGVIDNKGRIIWGDQLLALLAREVLAEQPGAAIVADVKSSQVLFDEIERLGGTPTMWKTGHSLVKEKMRETGSPLAGEMSGHIFYAHKYYGYDDGIYTGVRFLNVAGKAAEDGKSVADLRDELPVMVNTPELRFPCPEDRKFKVAAEVAERLKGTDAKIIAIDGVRVVSDAGWWLLRASNTQDVLVARCEARDEAGLQTLKAQLVEQLKLSGIEPPEF